MTRFVKFLLVVVLATAGAAGASGQALAAEPCANADTSASFLSQEEAEAAVLCLANAERANAGLPDLSFNQELANAARAHADAAVEIKWWHGDADWHTNPVTGSEPQDRMHEAGYCADGDLARAAENVYWGGATGDGAQAPTPADAVGWWMSSPGHRANLLDPELTELGVGVVNGAPAEPAPDAAAVFVQNFATCSTTPTPAPTCANADTSASFLSQEEAEAAVLCLANAERANAGLPDLSFNQELANAARAHADAAVEIKWWHGDADWHTNPVTGSEPQDRMHEAGYCADGDLARAAENVYWGGATGDGAQAPTPADAVGWWMSSPGHRANLLDPELTELGVGVVNGAPAEPAPDAAAVFVQNFATCSTTPTPAPTCANADTSASFLSQEEAEAAVLCLANAERANAGLPDLSFNQELANAARAHADAAVEIKWWHGDADWHTNPVTGSEPQDRMHEAGYCADGDLARAAENVYWGGATGDGAQAPTPADAVGWWMSSPGHRANLLDPELTELGVGVVNGAPAEPAPDAAAVFVQNFATCSI